jgi:two-component system cell cycle sensor histidine kinase/response regulator CckA
MSDRVFAPPDFKAVFESGPGLSLVLDPQLRVIAATRAFVHATGTSRDELLGREVFAAFPGTAGVSCAEARRNLRASLNRVMESRLPDSMGLQRYDVRRPESEGGGFEARYWSVSNQPLLNPDGSLAYILQRIEDITDLVEASRHGTGGGHIEISVRELLARVGGLLADRRSTGLQLRESEERFRVAQELSPDGFTILRPVRDAEGRVVDFIWVYENAAVARMNGSDPDAVVGRRLLEVFPSQRGTEFFEAYRQVAETGETRIFEAVAEGDSIPAPTWFRLAVVGMGSDIAVLAQDITERKGQEQALRESEQRFRFLFENSVDAVFLTAAEGQILAANPAACAMFGMTEEELAAAGRDRLVAPDDARHAPILEQRRRTGRVSGELTYVRKDGSRFPGEMSSVAIGDKGQAFVIVRDITQRKAIEERLRDSERRFRIMGETVPYGVWLCDPDGGARYTSQSFLDLLQMTQEEMQQFGWTGRLVREDVEPMMNKWLRCCATGEPWEHEHRFLDRHGNIVTILSKGRPVRDAEGRITCWVGVNLDITERKRTEERLRQAQKLESVGLLAGGIAHDFNNLLTGILGNASMALEDAGPNSADLIKAVVSNAERAANLTRQLLAYAGKGRFVVQKLDVSQAVNEMADLAQFSIPKSVELALNVRRRLPPIEADPGQLQQILMNLVINAGEAIGEGRTGKITVATSMVDLAEAFVDALGQEISPGRYVSIEVNDTGPGIDEQVKSKIFDPFFTTKFMGRGLGLAAVAGVVRSQRGALTLVSAPGRGTTFRVLLPAAGHFLQDAGQEAESDGCAATVLVVDDESSVRDFISAVLRKQGYRVLTAADGRQALARCEAEAASVQAAVVDIVMPLMGANDFLPALRSRYPRVRILLTSGYSEAEARRLCVAHPGAAFIQKPYTARQIAEAVAGLAAAPVA